MATSILVRMDNATARILNGATGDFYRGQARSFSDTRQAPWEGWQRVAGLARDAAAGMSSGETLEVLDVACGNQRFERYLADELAGRRLRFHTVDDCGALVESGGVLPAGVEISHRQLDVVEALLEAPSFSRLAPVTCGLVVSFGFFHHVPGEANRRRLLAALVESAALGGIVAVSLWRFMENGKLAEKARRSHGLGMQRLAAERGLDASQLESGDYLLGWQHSDALRYCHHFTPDEIDRLAASAAPSARLVARYRSDGRTHDLNTYLVFQRVE